MKQFLLYTVSTAMLIAASAASAQEAPKAEVLTSWTSGGEVAALNVIKNAFEAKGAEWIDSSIAGFGAADAAFQNRIVAGDPPTVKQAVVGRANQAFVDQGVLDTISDVAAAQGWHGKIPKLVEDYISYGEDTYLAPTGAHGSNWMFYSTEAFKKAGITETPATWDAFFADMEKLEAAGYTPIA